MLLASAMSLHTVGIFYLLAVIAFVIALVCAYKGATGAPQPWPAWLWPVFACLGLLLYVFPQMWNSLS